MKIGATARIRGGGCERLKSIFEVVVGKMSRGERHTGPGPDEFCQFEPGARWMGIENNCKLPSSHLAMY